MSLVFLQLVSAKLTIQPESNSWWIQLHSTEPAKYIKVSYKTSSGQRVSVTAKRPSWDSAHNYFTCSAPAEIPNNALTTFTLIKMNGKRQTMSMKFYNRNSVSSSGASSHSGGHSHGSNPSSSGSGHKIAYATWYDQTAAGTPVCGFKTKYCGAPSDQFEGLGERVGPCSGGSASSTCQNCQRGYCYGPKCVAPHCKHGGCNKKLKIWCVDTAPGACKTTKPIIMTINNICPKRHPCNTCKGGENPCARKDHLDLCESTFFAIANHQPRAKGLKIAFELVQ